MNEVMFPESLLIKLSLTTNFSERIFELEVPFS